MDDIWCSLKRSSKHWLLHCFPSKESEKTKSYAWLSIELKRSVAVDVFGSMKWTLLLPPTAVPTSTLGGRHDTQQLISIISPR